MKNKHPLSFCFLVGGIISVLAAIVAPESVFFFRIINGLFIGGLVLLLWFMCTYVSSLGLFDIVGYSFRKFGQYSKKNIHLIEENPEKKMGSFHDYLQTKAKKSANFSPLISGGMLIAISIALVLIDEFIL